MKGKVVVITVFTMLILSIVSASAFFLSTEELSYGTSSSLDVYTALTEQGSYTLSKNSQTGITTASAKVHDLQFSFIPPVLYPIADVYVDSGNTITLIANGVDPNGYPLSYAINDPRFTQNGNTFTWTPTVGGQDFNVVITAVSVVTGLSASEVVNIRVNQAPVLNTISPITVDSGQVVSITATASDLDGDSLTYSISDNRFTQSSPGVFTWTSSGITDLTPTVTVSDGRLTDSQVVSVTINGAPVLNPITPVSVNSGQVATLTATGSDPDGDSLTYSINDARFTQTSPGVFTWTTSGFVDATPTITVSDGRLTASQVGVVTVNVAPTLNAISPITVNSGQVVTITAVGADQDGDSLTYSIDDARFSHNGNGVFTWTSSGAADLTPTVTVSDGVLSASQSVSVTVNAAPTLAAIPAITVDTGSVVTITAAGADPDGDSLTYSISDNRFTQSSPGVFTWTSTGTADFSATVTVSDGALSASQSVSVTVNGAPVLSSFAPITVVAGNVVTITASATDPDGDSLTYSISDNRFTQSSPGVFTWTSSGAQTFSATVTVSDGRLTDSESVSVRVTGDPVLSPVADILINETDVATLTAVASDPNGATLTYTVNDSRFVQGASGVFSWTSPLGADSFDVLVTATNTYSLSDSQVVGVTVYAAPVLDTLADISVNETDLVSFTATSTEPNGLGVTYTVNDSRFVEGAAGEFSWTSTPGEQLFDILVTVTSDSGLTDSQVVTVMVMGAPVLDLIADITVNETDIATITATATEPNGLGLVYSINDSRFVEGAAGVFSWTSPLGADSFDVLVTVTSDSGLSDSQVVGVTVQGAPVLDLIADITINETDVATITATSTDPNGFGVTYSVNDSRFVEGAVGVFSWTSPLGADSFDVLVTVTSDSGLTDSQVVSVTVQGAPVLNLITDIRVNETDVATITATSTDPNGFGVTYSVNDSRFVEGATGVFSWTSPLGADSFDVLVTVTSDSGLTDSQVVSVTVQGAPVLNLITDIRVNETDVATITATSTDPNGFGVTYSVNDSRFVEGAVGVFSWTSPLGADSFDVLVTVTSDSGLTDSQVVSVTVQGAPVLNLITDIRVNETDAVIINASSTEPNGLGVTYSINDSRFTQNGADFNWTSPLGADSFDVLVSVISASGLSDSQVVSVTVYGAPVLDAIADITVNETDVVIINASSTEPNGLGVTYSINDSRFTQNGADFNWTSPLGADSFDVLVSVVSASGLSDSQVVSVTVQGAIVLDPIADIIVNETDVVSFTANVTEPNGFPYSVSVNDSRFTQNGSSFNWTSPLGADQFDVLVTANSSTGFVATQVVSVTVYGAPVLDAIADITVNETDAVIINASSTEPNGLGVTYSINDSRFTQNGADFNWTSPLGADSFDVLVSVVSASGLSDSQVVSVTVQGALTMEALSNVTINETDSINLTVNVTEPNGLAYTVSMNDSRFTQAGDSFNWTSPLGADSFDVLITANSSTGFSVSQIVGITVYAAPVLDNISDVMINETQEAIINATATEPNGLGVTFSINDSRFSQSGGNFNWTSPIGADNFDVLVSVVSASGLSDSQVVSVEVMGAPTLQTIDNIIANETDEIIIAVNASDPNGNNLTYSINDTRFSQNDSVFNWTSGLGSELFDVLVTVNSTAGFSMSQVVTIEIFSPPTMDFIDDIMANESDLVVLTASAVDANNGTITYSVNDSRFNQTSPGNFTWLSSMGTENFDVLVSATGESGLTTNQSVNIMITGLPVIETIDNVTINETEVVNITVNASEPNGLPISYAINDTRFTQDNNSFNWTSPLGADSFDVLITVNSSSGLTASQVVRVTVYGAPTLENISNITVNESDLVTVVFNFTEPNGLAVTSTLNDSRFNQTSPGTFTWTATGGAQNFDVLATIVSASGLSDSTVFNVMVVGAPTLELIDNITVNQTEVVNITANATDSNGFNISYAINDTRFTQDNNSFNWTSPVGADVFDVLVTVNNTLGLSTSQVVRVTIKGDPILTTIPNVSVGAFENVTITVIANDPTGANLTYAINDSNFTQNNNVFNWTSGAAGTFFDVLITVTNSDGFSVSQVVSISVVGAPVLDSIANITVNETDLIVLIANATDPNGANLTYAINDSNFNQSNTTQNGSVFTFTAGIGADQFDVLVSAENTFGYNDSQVVGITVLDTCTPNITNTTSSWVDIPGGCLVGENFTQERNITQYDANFCVLDAIPNVTFTEQRNVSCTLCNETLVNVTTSDWSNVTACVDNSVVQQRVITQYDANLCNTTANVTFTQNQTFSCFSCIPNWECTSWSEVGACSTGNKTRSCVDVNSCDDNSSRPFETYECSDTGIISNDPDHPLSTPPYGVNISNTTQTITLSIPKYAAILNGTLIGRNTTNISSNSSNVTNATNVTGNVSFLFNSSYDQNFTVENDTLNITSIIEDFQMSCVADSSDFCSFSFNVSSDYNLSVYYTIEYKLYATLDLVSGWNLVSFNIIDAIDYKTNLTLTPGWNLMGYVNREPLLWSTVLAHNDTAIYAYESAIANEVFQGGSFYYEDFLFKQVPLDHENFTYQDAYWIYANQEIQFFGQGSNYSATPDTHLVFASNGSTVLNRSTASTFIEPVFIGYNNTLKTEYNLSVGDRVSLYEGYWVYANQDDITLFVKKE